MKNKALTKKSFDVMLFISVVLILETILVTYQAMKLQKLENQVSAQQKSVLEKKPENVFAIVGEEWDGHGYDFAETIKTPDYWVTYLNKKLDFSFDFPNYFFLDFEDEMKLSAHNPGGGGFNNQININVADNLDNKDIESYVRQSYADIDSDEKYANMAIESHTDIFSLNPDAKEMWLINVLLTAGSSKAVIIKDKQNRIIQIMCSNDCSDSNMKHMAKSFRSPIDYK